MLIFIETMSIVIVDMREDFGQWLTAQLDERGWNQSVAARRGGFSASMFSKVVSGVADPGLDFLTGISRAFNMPLEDVLRRAGVLPELNVDAIDWARIESLPAADQEFFVRHMEELLDVLERKARERRR